MDVTNLNQTISASSNGHTYVTTDWIYDFFFKVSNLIFAVFDLLNKNISTNNCIFI